MNITKLGHTRVTLETEQPECAEERGQAHLPDLELLELACFIVERLDT